MLLTALHAILSALGVFFTTEGLKLYAWFDRQTGAVKVAAPYVVAFVAILIVRGFALPSTIIGWLWLAIMVAVLGLVAGGIFRTVKRFAPGDASAVVTR